MAIIVDLDAEYRLTRAALVDAGVDMIDSIDALYRDWRRWRDKFQSKAAADGARAGNLDLWWSRHLAQFRSLTDSPHAAARAERARKDQIAARVKHHPEQSGHSAVLAADAQPSTKD